MYHNQLADMRLQQSKHIDYLKNDHNVNQQFLENQHSIKTQRIRSQRDKNYKIFLALHTFDTYSRKPPSKGAFKTLIKQNN